MTKQIPLTKGKFATVDDEDYESLKLFRWHICNNYAARSVGRERIYMHREIMGSPITAEIDHINHDKLDNRHCNLRLASHAENTRNKKAHSDNPTGYKGVSWHKRDKKWQAQIKVDYKEIPLGYFNDAIQAARAYDAAALKYFGTFATLNFPSPSPDETPA